MENFTSKIGRYLRRLTAAPIDTLPTQPPRPLPPPSSSPPSLHLIFPLRLLLQNPNTRILTSIRRHSWNSPTLGGPQQLKINTTRCALRLRILFSLVKRATNVKRGKLVSLGTQIAANAKHKVWLKSTAEMSFLYGNSVLKGGFGRITENIQVKDGVVVFSNGNMGTYRWMAPKMIKDKPCPRKVDVYILKVKVV
ncbi:hypothetical protein ACS0TY_017396 [Phlomoides rotata]